MTQHRRSRTIVPIRESSRPWHEPTLADLLGDPIVEAVMEADSVNRQQLREMLGDVARALRANRQSRSRPGGIPREKGPYATSPCYCA
jgi:hypothetical protein